MKILAVDIGTGTQDILLLDTRLDIENSYKLVLPSPTMMLHGQINAATRRREALLLHGVMMGGGPCQWAAEAHLRAGLPVYATQAAARTFNDDLSKVQEMGIQVVSDDEALGLPEDVRRLEMRDFDFPAIRSAFSQFGVSLDELRAVAVAVFDHGDAPPDISDRQFRFDYLDSRIRAENRLSAFAYLAEDAPASMTRMQAVIRSAGEVQAPLVVMDTAPAAVLGATFDPHLADRPRLLVANLGNFHSLAFRLSPAGIEGVFEHHTGLVDRAKLERLLRRLADGSLTHAHVFDDHGHGALVYQPEPLRLGEGDFDVAVTGPRGSLLRSAGRGSSGLRPYFAVPFGDMMLAGCFGLLAATADLLPDLRDAVRAVMRQGHTGSPPWEA